MLEKFIVGAVVALIFIGTPKLYRLGKRKKAEAIENGNIYYGLLGCRVMGLYLAGVISADIILMMLLGDSIEGMIALLIMLVISMPFTVLYVWLYKKRFREKYLKLGVKPKAGRRLEASEVEYAVSTYLNKHVTLSDIACTLVYVIPTSTNKPQEMHLYMTVGDQEFSSLDLIFFDQHRKAYYFKENRLALDESWLPASDIFNFDVTMFKTFEIERDSAD